MAVGAAISARGRRWRSALQSARGRRSCGRRSCGRRSCSAAVLGIAINTRGWRSWLAVVVGSSGWHCNQLMVGARVVGCRGRHCHQHSWSTVVVGAAIIARGRRSWSALPSALVVGVRGRRCHPCCGQRWRSTLRSAPMIDGCGWRCDQRSWSAFVVGVLISARGREWHCS